MSDQRKASIFLVIGDDKITRNLFSSFIPPKNVTIISDQSGGLRRVIKLLKSGALPLFAFSNMVFAEVMRKNNKSAIQYDYVVKSNDEILDYFNEHSPSRIILFRAGLIVKRDRFPKSLEFWNLHCASLPNYGGIASIYRALKDRVFQQSACLHEVTNRIDGGRVLEENPYCLSEDVSYRENEDRAYAAGFKLLLRRLYK